MENLKASRESQMVPTEFFFIISMKNYYLFLTKHLSDRSLILLQLSFKHFVFQSKEETISIRTEKFYSHFAITAEGLVTLHQTVALCKWKLIFEGIFLNSNRKDSDLNFDVTYPSTVISKQGNEILNSVKSTEMKNSLCANR